MDKQKILIPLDGSEHSRQIIPMLQNLFTPEMAEIYVIEVIDPRDLPMMEADVITVSEVIEEVVRSGGASRSERLAEVDRRHHQRDQAILHQREEMLSVSGNIFGQKGYSVYVHAEIGNPAETIVAYAKRVEVDLIAMATHGRSGLSKLMMGSVAEQVLRQSSTPVLLLRPSQDK